MILGLIRPTSGRVLLLGEEFTRRDWQRLRGVGTLVEAPSLYGHLTGRENLEVVRRMLGLPKSRIDHALGTVGLQGQGDKLVRQYSLGMQQRLALALALLDEPSLLVLDEPTNGLDPSGIQEIRALIRDMPQQTGASVFLSSHLLSEVELMATHVGIIDHGCLRYEGRLAELKRRWGAMLTVRVDRASEAATLIASLGWPADPFDGGVQVRNADEAVAYAVNRALLAQGFEVRQVHLRQAGLEEMFLEMTAPTPARGEVAR
jgi:ABC-2 type transport system ATP-binding protein